MRKEKKIKILYFIQLPPPVHGVSEINKQIYESDRINMDVDKSLLEIKFSDSMSQLRRLTFLKILQFIRLSFKLFGKLREFRPDFIYFSLMPIGRGFLRDLVYVIIIKLSGVIPVYHLHNKGIEKNSRFVLLKWVYRYVFKNSYVIHLSQGLLKNEILDLGIKNVRTRVITNGIKREVIEENRGKDDYFNILYLSNLFPDKGFIELIKVIDALKYDYPNIFLNIVGAFPNKKARKKVKRLIDQYGLRDRVLLKGPRYGEKKQQEYGIADLFVFPTFFRQECFPLVILEAMQARLPIITTNEGAISEILDHEINGIIIPQKDNNALASQIKRLGEDKDLLMKLGYEAWKKFVGNFTLEHFENNMRDFFEKELIKKAD